MEWTAESAQANSIVRIYVLRGAYVLYPAFKA